MVEAQSTHAGAKNTESTWVMRYHERLSSDSTVPAAIGAIELLIEYIRVSDGLSFLFVFL
jgi:hypothetical protein